MRRVFPGLGRLDCPASMIRAYRRKIENSKLEGEVRAKYLKELEDGFKGYTYHEK